MLHFTYLIILSICLSLLGCQSKNSQQSEISTVKTTKKNKNNISKNAQISQSSKTATKSTKPALLPLKAKEKKEIRSEENEPAEYNSNQKRAIKLTKEVKQYCQKIDEKFESYKWGKSGCENVQWMHVRDSFLGTPLIWGVFGDEAKIQSASKEQLNTTLILCGVHGDEITPVKFCFDLIHYLKAMNHPWEHDLVAIAPIVTPDSFFRKRPTRTNYRGVDVNRNFPTKDWNKDALRLWKQRYRKDPRRFPGKKPLSEHETLFQVNLIKRYRPSKIISVHAPLTILDYDGPTGEGGIYLATNANDLLKTMSKSAKGYKIKNYPFFPGSLGNYAGNERGIPTYTLELPSSDYTKHGKFWNRFRESLYLAIFKNLNTKTADSSSNSNEANDPDPSNAHKDKNDEIQKKTD